MMDCHDAHYVARPVRAPLQYYRDASHETLSMEQPKSVAKKGSADTGRNSEVSLGDSVNAREPSPEDKSQKDLLRDRVTQLLMTLTTREKEVSAGAAAARHCSNMTRRPAQSAERQLHERVKVCGVHHCQTQPRPARLRLH